MKTTATNKVDAVKPVCNELSEARNKHTGETESEKESRIAKAFGIKSEQPGKATPRPLEWQRLGVCAMDTAGLLIADPCYVIKQGDRDDLEIQDYSQWVSCEDEILRLNFKRGHEGAGVIVHSPNGDGSVDICGEVDDNGRIRSVYFSFDGEEPISRAEHAALVAALDKINAIVKEGVIHRSETGKPQWSAFDEIRNIIAAVRGGKAGS